MEFYHLLPTLASHKKPIMMFRKRRNYGRERWLSVSLRWGGNPLQKISGAQRHRSLVRNFWVGKTGNCNGQPRQVHMHRLWGFGSTAGHRWLSAILGRNLPDLRDQIATHRASGSTVRRLHFLSKKVYNLTTKKSKFTSNAYEKDV